MTLTGWNLKKTTLLHDNTELGTAWLAGDFLNRVPFAVDNLPESVERPPNDSIKSAQSLTLPVIVNGRIGRTGERDVFKFEGRAGQKIVAEVFARRLDSPLDSNLRLTDAGGKQIAFNDDCEDKACGLETHHADSCIEATLPADGNYFIELADTQGRGGAEFAYRLRVSEPQPDFALRIVPSSLSLRAGMSVPVTIFALRKEGFTNAISLNLKDAPPGFSLSGASVGVNQEKAQFTLKAPSQPTDDPASISIEGNALIDGKRVTHDAEPAEDMMQAFIYRHLVPSQELAVSVNGMRRPFLASTFKILSPTPVKISPGGTARVRVSAPPGNLSDRFNLKLTGAPEGISLVNTRPVSTGLELVFASDKEKVKPGSAGNLICEIVPQFKGQNEKQKKAVNQVRRDAAATLPAISYIVTE